MKIAFEKDVTPAVAQDTALTLTTEKVVVDVHSSEEAIEVLESIVINTEKEERPLVQEVQPTDEIIQSLESSDVTLEETTPQNNAEGFREIIPDKLAFPFDECTQEFL